MGAATGRTSVTAASLGGQGAENWLGTWFSSGEDAPSTRLRCIDGDGEEHVFFAEDGEFKHSMDGGVPGTVTSFTVQRTGKMGLLIFGNGRKLHLKMSDISKLVPLARSVGVRVVDGTKVKVETASPMPRTRSSIQAADEFLFARTAVPAEAGAASKDVRGYVVMGKYVMHLDDKDLCGEGSSSICRRGTHMGNGKRVAIKYYKATPDDKKRQKAEEIVIAKFRRQVEVLQELQRPVNAASDGAPSRLEAEDEFVQMLDYSKGPNGEPGPDRRDGTCYIIMELADYSLHDYLCICSEQGHRPRKDMVRRIARAIVGNVAALHARGFAHLDLKPANFMVFSGRIKLIDVDGCVALGTSVSLFDNTLSCSPAYVAPEWARFCCSDAKNPSLPITAGLDIWSLGMIMCELVTLDPVLCGIYKALAKQHATDRWAVITYKFYQWLGGQDSSLVPPAVEEFDEELARILEETLLSCDASRRRSLQDIRSLEYFAQDPPALESTVVNEAEPHAEGSMTLGRRMTSELRNFRLHLRNRKIVVPMQFNSSAGCLHSKLWKLRTAGDPTNPNDWVKRDVWLPRHCGLTLWNSVEERPVTYYSKGDLASASLQILPEEGSCKPWSFIVQLEPAANGTVWEAGVFATDTEQLRKQWMGELSRLADLHGGTKVKKMLTAPAKGAGARSAAARKASTRSGKTVQRVSFLTAAQAKAGQKDRE